MCQNYSYLALIIVLFLKIGFSWEDGTNLASTSPSSASTEDNRTPNPVPKGLGADNPFSAFLGMLNPFENLGGVANSFDVEDRSRSHVGEINPEQDSTYTEVHMHPHPAREKYPNAKTILRFTYGENDTYGPANWDNTPSALLTTNDCPTNKLTPLNINTTTAGLADRDSSLLPEMHQVATSLTLLVGSEIKSTEWEFGFPEDTFNGITIFPKSYGTLQLLDEYDSHAKQEGMPSRMFDFTFGLVTYCDFSKHSTNRSGHQIDGKRFPFEIHLLFFGYGIDIGIDKIVFGDKKNDIVMVSVLGEISKEDNVDLNPLINAAKNFTGENYGSDDVLSDSIQVSEPFSPLIFIPKHSGYFYYKGNFPLPPCFGIPRVYVLGSQISISQKQLDVLTNLKSKREPSGELSCTFPLLQVFDTETQIFHNPTPILYNRNTNEESNEASKNFIISDICSNLFVFVLVALIS